MERAQNFLHRLVGQDWANARELSTITVGAGFLRKRPGKLGSLWIVDVQAILDID
jgi:hypothetical protein